MNAVVAEDFWSLLRQSRLFGEDVCDALEAEFERSHGERYPEDLSVLVDWLVEQNALSEYQSLVLQAGRSGPFFYGDYKVYDRVAQGALAGTFRAVHVPTSHLVTLQFLRGEALTDAAAWKTIVDRSLKLASVRHPFVLPFLEPVDLDSFKFLAYEDPGSLTVRDWLKNGPLQPPEVCRIVRDLAKGLEALHDKKTTAADFRPERIFTTTGGALRLLVDPSQKRGTFDEMAESSPEDLERRADYLAPEFSLPTQRPNPQTDIYALGCLAYELLAGRPPFQGGDVTSKLQRHASEPIEKLEPLGVPPKVAKLVAFMMAKNPDVRIPSATDLAGLAESLLPPEMVRPRVAMPPETAAPYEQWIKAKRARLARSQREKALNAALPTGPRAAAAGVGVGSAPTAAAIPAAAIPPSVLTAKKRFSLKRAVPMIGAVLGALLFGAAVLYFVWNSVSEPIVAVDPDRPGTGGETTGGGGAKTPGDGDPTIPGAPIVLPDDGKSLYVSPTKGQPLTLELVPPEAQVYLFLRPAALLGDAQTAPIIEKEALGPETAAGLKWVEEVSGLSLAEIDRLLVAVYPNGGQLPRVALRIDPVVGVTRDQLLERWNKPEIRNVDGLSSFSKDGRTFILPDDSTRVLIAGADDAKETLATKGAAPVMRREMQALLETTDSDRDATILFAPNFFFGDGRKLFVGTREKLVDPLAAFLGSGIQAGSLSLDVGELFYIEMRLASDAGTNDLDLAEAMKERLAQVPTQVEDHVIYLNPSPYWRKVAFRYADMIAFLYENARVGTADRQATLNAYLPSQAAADLLVGTELVVHAAPGEAAVASAEEPTGPQTLEEALDAKMSLDFAQESLEQSVLAAGAQLKAAYPRLPFEVKIKVVGGDLELNGITRNQQVRNFDEQDKTFAEILTAIVRKANPITTVKDASELDQKLIWVVANDPDTGEKSVLITTRDAAEKNKYELPKPFQPKAAEPPPAESTE